MRWLSRAAAALCILTLLPTAARSAVSDFIGKPIGRVRLLIEGRDTADPALTQVVETLVGQPLAMAAVRETISHLFSLGRFEGVRVDAEVDGGRVTLRYELTPVHPVTQIAFAGEVNAPGIDPGALRRALTDRYGITPPLARSGDMAHLVEQSLAERGYLRARVTPQTRIAHDPDRATLTLTITPNARTTVGTVRLTGRPSVSRDVLLRRLGVSPGSPYERDRLNAGIERFLAERRGAGYYEARITPIVTVADDARTADVTLDVNPGPHVRVVFGGDTLPADRRDELVPIEREGSADEDLLEDSSNRIEEYFRNQGYRNASAPHNRVESDGELLITFSIARGPLYRVARYEISGVTAIPLDALTPLLRVRVDQPFADSRLDADVATIEAVYRRQGFATARARSAVEPLTPATAGVVPVAVRVVVTEGPRTTVDSITFDGNASVSEQMLRSKLRVQPGGPYVPSQIAADRDAIQATYQDLGFQTAAVDVVPQFTAEQTRAAVTYRITEGPRIFVDHILIVGNVRTRTETIQRELQIKEGEPYSVAAITESQRRLAALGLFRRVRINDIRHASATMRDLLVSVEEAPPTTIGYGFGGEGRRLAANTETGATERVDIAPRALFEIGRRNLFGRNRSANLFTSVSRSLVSNLTEYRAVATFREPRLLDTAADAFVNGTLEQQHRSTFDFARRSFSANVERRFPGPYRVTGTYQLQRTRVFNLKVDENDPNLPLIDRTFPQFLLSSFSGSLIRDTRDDALDTHDGTYASANSQLAASAIGSEVGFVKSFFTAQLFRTLPHARRAVFAGNARLGTATGFTTATGLTGSTTRGELPASERFFAGGDTTVRGFALDQLGVRHTPTRAGDTVDEKGFAIGGNGLVIFNAELRVSVTSALGVVGFVDTGNVFARVADIDLGELRTALGGGLRYKSPVGPLRFDLGFKVNPQSGESRAAWFVSFGQAF
jgi:outer membrane protein insertion porin family